ncbi:MFS transporter (plasmid) [Burkholderia thailandensis]|uniref:MFS transporter n=1 Tax=Burkholderia thailandensis TaxID=57975 RepID=UPI00192D2F6C|nr:MFS transporter [Burkholderia thailandensis]MBS2132179.1 MFS transporter [Burkholderia thailandensis]QRA15278.1 MFS transporter [Burkholderia thailandensis]
MKTHPTTQPLPWQVFVPLLLAMFASAIGYGFLLPILPRILESIAATSDPETLSRHTGLLTGIYTLPVFFFAPLWGRLSDHWGPRPVTLLGLAGFAVTLALFVAVSSLPLLYLDRALGGVFAAAIAPAVYAFVSDRTPSESLRARRFAILNVSGSAGFLVGPMLGSLTLRIVYTDIPHLAGPLSYWPPVALISIFSLLVGCCVFALVPSDHNHEWNAVSTTSQTRNRAALLRLLAISFVAAGAVGAFEVGLALRGTQTLGMNLSDIGLMFTECSVVMLAVQFAVFSPFVKPDVTRLLLTPALLVFALGLVAIPLMTSRLSLAITVAIVAGSAGIISPIATYWISVAAGERQGAALGQQTSAASLGQTVGSASGGLLFNVTFLSNATFTLTAVIVLASVFASVRVPRLLAESAARMSTREGSEP